MKCDNEENPYSTPIGPYRKNDGCKCACRFTEGVAVVLGALAALGFILVSVELVKYIIKFVHYISKICC